MSNKERVLALKQNIQNSAETSSSIEELKAILSTDCAELDKAQVS